MTDKPTARHIRLTSHPGQQGLAGAPAIEWGAADPLVAREQIRALNGTAGTWFCGAWMRNGFHEDGFASALDVVQALRTRRNAMAVQ